MRSSLLTASFLVILSIAAADVMAQNIGDRILRKAKQRVDQKIERAIDKGLDEVEEGVEEGVKGEKESESKDGSSGGSTPSEDTGTAGTSSSGKASPSAPAAPTFAAYSKFDFIPGDKVIAFEDFAQDAIGDFPDKWNTNGGGEVVTIEGRPGHWLAFTTKGGVTPEFINSLPENFTLEFDLLCNPGYDFYATSFDFSIADRTDPTNFSRWPNAVKIELHPKDATSRPTGRSWYRVFQNNQEVMNNQRDALACFNNSDRNYARISIWRQNQRIRVYVNETKVWDLPRAFVPNAKYNSIIFERGNAAEGNYYYISNLRLAVGAPDTRNKLLTEGRFSTTGIYFNTNSADIKPESYGILKEIADVLSANPEVKIAIIGHTDSDGDEAHNLDLSKRRAASVRQALIDNFGISGDRMQTDGKGESQPAEKNDTPAGKAANRRVEFVKL
jgi:outer membrane protein OmpA-like peptidoglycan-associated protein